MDCSKRLTPGALHTALRLEGRWRWDESHGGDIGDMAVPNHGSEIRGYGMMANSDPVVPVLPKRRDESEGGGNKGRAQLPR
jgi:hypothetical protein